MFSRLPPHGATRGCRPGTCQASALPAEGCLQVWGAWGCFFFASRSGRPLGTERRAKALLSLRARSPSAKPGSSRLFRGVSHSGEPPGWCGVCVCVCRAQTPGSFASNQGRVPSSATFGYPHLRPLIDFSSKPLEAKISRYRLRVSFLPAAAGGAPAQAREPVLARAL